MPSSKICRIFFSKTNVHLNSSESEAKPGSEIASLVSLARNNRGEVTRNIKGEGEWNRIKLCKLWWWCFVHVKMQTKNLLYNCMEKAPEETHISCQSHRRYVPRQIFRFQAFSNLMRCAYIITPKRQIFKCFICLNRYVLQVQVGLCFFMLVLLLL